MPDAVRGIMTENTHRIFLGFTVMDRYQKYLNLLAGAFVLLVSVTACVTSSRPDDVDGQLDEISTAMAYGDYDLAQKLCDSLLEMVSATDSAAVSENQAGTLGIMYMKLSEHRNEDENVADATICVRYAYRHSADSLKAFSASLPLEDQRHFVLLRRIGLSIDNPVDLSDSDISHEDYPADSVE